MTSRSDSSRDVAVTVMDALSEVASLCAPERYWDADESERLQVASWTVQQALECPASAAAELIEPFAPDVQKVWRAGALDGLRLLNDPADTPVTAYRKAYRDGTNWVWQWVKGSQNSDERASKAEQAIVGQRAIGFISGAARVLGGWPPSGYQSCGASPEWLFPGRALRLRGRADVMLQEDGDRVIVLIYQGAWTAHLRARIAYEALLATLKRLEPVKIRAVFPDVGPSHTIDVPVDQNLLAEGINVAQIAAQVVAAQLGFIDEPQPRTPCAKCRFCSISNGCVEGQTWLNGPGARRFGIPLRGSTASAVALEPESPMRDIGPP